ncbi:MAG: LysO family transporter [Bacteroidales bacterium]
MINQRYNRLKDQKGYEKNIFAKIYIMVSLILTLLAGILIGRLFRNCSWIKFSAKIIFPIVLILLFLMGITIGLNDEIIMNINRLGKEALIITAGAIAGTLLGAALIWHFIFSKKINK